MKQIILCADDYGQNTAISQAIIDLFNKNRLTATSCLTNFTDWFSHAAWIEPYHKQFDLGLHFNLTEGKPLSDKLGDEFPSLSQLIFKSYLGQLSESAIEEELNKQLDRFEEGIGQLPRFIDGHQHVHQLPMIRNVLLRVYEKRLRATNCYIRSVFAPRNLIGLGNGYVKRLIIQLCGAFKFKKLLNRNEIPHNPSFSGFYNFHPQANYPQLFNFFLQQIDNRGLIMCHPAKVSLGAIGDARLREYEYFMSEQFIKDCLINKILLTGIK